AVRNNPVKGVVSVEPPREKASSSASHSATVRYLSSSDRWGRKISTRVRFSKATNQLPECFCTFRQRPHASDRFLGRVFHRYRMTRISLGSCRPILTFRCGFIEQLLSHAAIILLFANSEKLLNRKVPRFGMMNDNSRSGLFRIELKLIGQFNLDARR